MHTWVSVSDYIAGARRTS